jgi:hypothetical protein
MILYDSRNVYFNFRNSNAKWSSIYALMLVLVLEMYGLVEKPIIRVGSHVMRFIIVEQVVGLNALKSENISSRDFI